MKNKLLSLGAVVLPRPELAEQLEAAGQAQDALSHRAAARIAREQGRQAMQEAEVAGAEAATLSRQGRGRAEERPAGALPS